MNLTIKLRNNSEEVFAELTNEWLVASAEEIVRQKFIHKLINDYGYQSEQISHGDKTDNQNNTNPDILIWKSVQDKTNKAAPFIIVDCHATAHIKNTDYLEVENYALFEGAKFFITYYQNDKKEELRVFKFSEEKPPLQIVELDDIPKAAILNDDTEIDNLLRKVKHFSKEEFKKIFFACHDAIRNNDKLSPEMAFDEISKVLFIKIRYEKENSRIFDKSVFESLNKEYQELFNEVKEKYKNDDIFEAKDSLRIRKETFLQILDKLSAFNLAEVPEDVKGVAFEEFLGKTFRGDLGQFFTPRTLVDFMVNVLDPQEGELVADPCCGSGGFLIKSFDYIKENISNDIRHKKNELRKEIKNSDFASFSPKKQTEINSKLKTEFEKLDKDLNNSVENSRLYRLSNNCIYGTDAEPRSARTAKMNMIMQGDGHSGVHHNDGLLNINGIFENRFDVILTNPPFGARVSKDLMLTEEDILYSEEKRTKFQEKYGDEYSNVLQATFNKYKALKAKKEAKSKDKNQEIYVPLLDFYDLGEISTLTEVLFMERCLNLLKPGGRMGVVLPEGFLNGADLQRVREYIESRAKLIFIVSVPQDVFISAGASVKSSLVFLKKFTEAEAKQYADIQKTVRKEIEDKYQSQIEEKEKEYKLIWQQIQTSDDKKTSKKEFDKWHKEILAKIETEIKAEVKNRFDYEIPIVQVNKAGISSIGTSIENDLMWQKDEPHDEDKVKVLDEFRAYWKLNPLWQPKTVNF